MRSSIVLLVALLVIGVHSKGDLVEWELNLFQRANANKNAQCEGFEILEPPGHYAGYYTIDGTEDGHLSYMYFENRYKDPDAPLLFWTNGGPGCSSFFGLFMENGPYDIQEDLTLCWKEHGWDVGHDIVFVEQPIGVGFSYSSDIADKVLTDERVGHDILEFFYAFLEQHPELVEKDLYLSGESFGGHYLPVIAKAMIIANAHMGDPQLRLKGVFMIDPWTSPSSIYYSYPEYAYEEGLISRDTRDQMFSAWGYCDNALRLCDMKLPYIRTFSCNAAYAFCQSRLFTPVLFLHPFLNYYDIRRRDCYISGCYDISLLTRFMNNPDVKEALGVKEDIDWENCDDAIRRELGWDVATDVKSTVAAVLNQGVNVSIVNGDRDFICNYKGNERWTERMVWDKADEWASAERQTLKVAGNDAGYVRQVTPLSFVKVANAGHMIPMDQPVVGLELITTFTRGKDYPTAASKPLLVT